MNLNDLNSLKLALDTRNHSFYRGGMNDALSELVDEMELTRLALEDAGFIVEDFAEAVKSLTAERDGALDEVAKLEEDAGLKDVIMEIDFLTCKIEGVERITERVKTFENKDAEHPVKVVIMELR